LKRARAAGGNRLTGTLLYKPPIIDSQQFHRENTADSKEKVVNIFMEPHQSGAKIVMGRLVLH